MIEYLLALNALSFLIMIAGGAVLFHKLRRIHGALFHVSRLAEEGHKEVLTLYPQIQSLISLDRILKLERPIPRTRGWAASPDFLELALTEAMAPSVRYILECSSGTSTIVLARYLQLKGHGHVYSLEHDPGYARETRELLESHGLSEWASVLDAPLEPDTEGILWYSLQNLPASLESVELVVIDGPPRSVARLARYPAAHKLAHLFGTTCTILLDDASRPDEVEILRRWKRDLPEFSQSVSPLEKGAAILRRRCDGR